MVEGISVEEVGIYNNIVVVENVMMVVVTCNGKVEALMEKVVGAR